MQGAVDTQADTAGMSIAEVADLVHELQVHQIQLEMQAEDLRQAQIELTQSNDRLVNLYDFAPVGYVTHDDGGVVLEANLTLATMLGTTRAALLGRTLTGFVARDAQDALYLHLQAVRESDRTLACDVGLLRRDRSTVAARLETIVVRDAGSGARRFRSAIIDIGERVRVEEQLRALNLTLEQRVADRTAEADRRADQVEALAHHDALTGLPNRLLFNDRLDHALEVARRATQRCAVLFLDLDGFKTVNDTVGHAGGDLLLKVLADRLRACLRRSDTAARFGGDEFVLVMADITYAEDSARFASKLLTALELPVDLAGARLTVSASIGISVYPDDGADGSQLIKAADTAMYTAKARGRGRYCFYTEELAARAAEHLDIEQGVKRALMSDELLLHYQPIVSLGDGAMIGAEALLRWQRPLQGLVPPERFIPIAEETGLIESLGRWALTTACRETVAWMSGVGQAARLSVNVSARQLVRDQFSTIVREILTRPGCPLIGSKSRSPRAPSRCSNRAGAASMS